jgi:hypothetical protein
MTRALSATRGVTRFRTLTSAAFVLACIVSIVASTAAPGGASAQPLECSTGNGKSHFHSVATRRVIANGYDVQFHANFMTPGRSGPDHVAHITAESWVLMRNHSWVEVGIINGWPAWPDNKQGPNPNVAYAFFWADAGPGGCMTGATIHTIRNTVPDGSNHHFAIVYAGNKSWNVYLDGQVVGTSTVTRSNQPLYHQIGLEIGEVDGLCGDGSRADDVRMKPSTWTPRTGWRPWPHESSTTSTASRTLMPNYWYYRRGGQSEFSVSAC